MSDEVLDFDKGESGKARRRRSKPPDLDPHFQRMIDGVLRYLDEAQCGPAPTPTPEIVESANVDESGLQTLLDALPKKPTPADAPPPPPRLTVDLACLTITLDGHTYDVDSIQALRWVKVLADHPGEWISGPELKKHDTQLDGCRPDRHCKPHLPDNVLSLIDSDRRKGSRLRLS
jgi:hypothetical protein